MPFYVEIEHIDDDDADYRVFSSLDAALFDIMDSVQSPLGKESRRWAMSNTPISLPESEYTFIE